VTRSLPARLSALLWAVIFLLSTAGDGLALAPCPHHGMAAEHSEQPAEHHGHDAAHAAASDEHAPPADHSGGCTCIGECQAGTGASLPAHAPSSIGASVVAASVDAPAAPRGFVARHPPYFLPYGLAPPAHG
jgi:hypothetical protein